MDELRFLLRLLLQKDIEDDAQKVRHVNLTPNEREWSLIQQAVRVSLPEAHIKGAERLVHPELYRRFQQRSAQIINNDGEDGVSSQRLLFHGTNHPLEVCANENSDVDSCGFKPNLSSDGEYSSRGCASYFAPYCFYPVKIHPKYRNGSGLYEVILAEVTLGRSYDFGDDTSPGMEEPPMDYSHAKEGSVPAFHSIQGTENGIARRIGAAVLEFGRQFVVFDRYQAYPHYRIALELPAFERSWKCVNHTETYQDVKPIARDSPIVRLPKRVFYVSDTNHLCEGMKNGESGNVFDRWSYKVTTDFMLTNANKTIEPQRFHHGTLFCMNTEGNLWEIWDDGLKNHTMVENAPKIKMNHRLLEVARGNFLLYISESGDLYKASFDNKEEVWKHRLLASVSTISEESWESITSLNPYNSFFRNADNGNLFELYIDHDQTVHLFDCTSDESRRAPRVREGCRIHPHHQAGFFYSSEDSHLCEGWYDGERWIFFDFTNRDKSPTISQNGDPIAFLDHNSVVYVTLENDLCHYFWAKGRWNWSILGKKKDLGSALPASGSSPIAVCKDQFFIITDHGHIVSYTSHQTNSNEAKNYYCWEMVDLIDLYHVPKAVPGTVYPMYSYQNIKESQEVWYVSQDQFLIQLIRQL